MDGDRLPGPVGRIAPDSVFFGLLAALVALGLARLVFQVAPTVQIALALLFLAGGSLLAEYLRKRREIL